MPGLVKVGRTTRDPAERANELSGATGVPTPFVLAFKRRFNDCEFAEKAIHAALALADLRESESREFFRADASLVVEIVLAHKDVPASADPALSQPTIAERYPGSNPWDEMLSEGIKYELGYESYLQDKALARRCYRDAASLGSAEGLEYLGRLLANGDGGPTDIDGALKCWNDAIRKGHFVCWAKMGQFYYSANHEQNTWKCYDHFFNSWMKEKKNGSSLTKERFVIEAMAYLIILGDRQPSVAAISAIAPLERELVQYSIGVRMPTQVYSSVRITLRNLVRQRRPSNRRNVVSDIAGHNKLR